MVDVVIDVELELVDVLVEVDELVLDVEVELLVELVEVDELVVDDDVVVGGSVTVVVVDATQSPWSVHTALATNVHPKGVQSWGNTAGPLAQPLGTSGRGEGQSQQLICGSVVVTLVDVVVVVDDEVVVAVLLVVVVDWTMVVLVDVVVLDVDEVEVVRRVVVVVVVRTVVEGAVHVMVSWRSIGGNVSIASVPR